MESFGIYIAFISWGSGGKRRPVLVISQADAFVSVFRITTQYENKSEAVRTHYFPISEWSEAGLEKQSYVDTGEILELPVATISERQPIGYLSAQDKEGLLEFLS